MEYKDKISALAVLAHASGMMYALACMEGATITKRLSLALDDQLDHVDEALDDIFKEAMEEDVIPDDGQKTKIGFGESRTEGTPPHQ